MTPNLRKLVLTAHVVSSVGWLGAVLAYLALAIAGLRHHDAGIARAAYLSMDLLGWSVIVPLSLASIAIGLGVSLATPWGLFRHYWVLTKFILTIGATVVLLQHMPAVSRMADAAAKADLLPQDLLAERIQLVVHAAGGLIVLLAITTLSVYKPFGLTAYGRRKKQLGAAAPIVPVFVDVEDQDVSPRSPTGRTPRWVYVVAIHAIALLLIVVGAHIAGGGMRGH